MEYTQTELRIMAIAAAIGAALSWLLGGIDGTVTALLVFIVLDYATGMYAAWSTGVLSSGRGFDGIKRKVIMLLVVVIAHQLDAAMHTSDTFKTVVVFAYLGNEGISICENIDRMGYGNCIPNFLRNKLVQLRDEKKNMEVDHK